MSRAAVANPVSANLVMLALIVSGLLIYRRMPREVFPDFSLDTVEVFTVLAGASPTDVERLVTVPLEDALEGVDGIDELRSTSREGTSRIVLTLEDGVDVAGALADARDAVRSGDVELPEDAEDPLVYEAKNRFPVIAVFIYGAVEAAELRRVARAEARALEALPGVSGVVPTGNEDPRIWVELDPDALERHGVTFDEAAAVLGERLAEAPLGSLEVGERSRLLRVGGDVALAMDLADLPVVTRADGAEVPLERLARRIVETTERGATRGRFNGRPCVHLQVQKDAEGDTIDIAAAVREYVATREGRMPPGLAIGTNSDLSVYVANRLRTMTESGMLGAALVVLALLMFLSPRIALVTALGIPLSFLGGILIGGALGVTMNMVTMFALIVVLGMIVDDAIVVGENVYRRIEEGDAPEVAAVEGTSEVGRAVVATILTSIAAFLPILLLPGTTGLFMRPLPVIVSACLVVSLFEAFTILPAHLAHWTSKRATARLQAEARAAGGRVRRWYSPAQDAYVALLRGALGWRWASLAAFVAAASLTYAFASSRIPFVLFDDFEGKLFYVSARLDPSASIDDTSDVTRQLEGRVRAAVGDDVVSMHTLMGVAASDAASYELGEHLGQVWVELREGAGRTRTTAEVLEDVRASLDGLPPIVESVEIELPSTGPSGRAIAVSLRGEDLAALDEEARALAQRMQRFRGVRDVRSDYEPGKEEVRVEPRAEARRVGIGEGALARELRTAFEGRVVGSVRRGEDAVDVVLKYPEELRSAPRALGRVRVALPPDRVSTRAEGGVDRVELRHLADARVDRGPSSIGHEERMRAVVVSADVEKSEGNASKISETLRAELDAGFLARNPGASYRLRGQAEETRESLDGLLTAGTISLMLIYLILGTLFESFLAPLVIMFVIPFAGIGVVFGHALMDRPITLMSLIGLLALAGVVVNDSLILVDFVLQRRRRGVALLAAVLESGRLRFRPIVLTSITTMLGLMPLTFFATGQARFLQPMAISIFFGLFFGTALILVLVPLATVALDDLVRAAGALRHEVPGGPSGAEPIGPGATGEVRA
ncbi:MAG: efflux RND transporter permease subunit [Planctomycetota bacterium]